ncbi:MAG: hypothetical protein K6F77_10300 [Lachnospiraceae bacterium]|nr:hypothetical protein [Lachnospiraceae bacterium]
MLKKVFKYDIYGNMKLFSMLYLIVGVLFIISLVLNQVNKLIPEDIQAIGLTNFVCGLSMFLMYFSCMLLVGASSLLCAVLFYKSVATNEGYLTHTLPVTKKTLVLGKSLAGLVYCFISLIIGFACAAIHTAVVFPDTFNSLLRNLKDSFYIATHSDEFTPLLVISVIIFILAFVAQVFFNINLYYCCVSFGQINNSHKIIMSIVAYIVYTMVIQFLSGLISFGFSLAISINPERLQNFQAYMDAHPDLIMLIISLVVLLFNIGFSALAIHISSKTLEKKLNLQ